MFLSLHYMLLSGWSRAIGNPSLYNPDTQTITIIIVKVILALKYQVQLCDQHVLNCSLQLLTKQKLQVLIINLHYSYSC